MKLKVYGASKLHHAPMWHDLKQAYEGIEWTARWPFEHVGKVPDTPEFAKRFWQEDEWDVRRSDIVLVYAEPKDHLRGALVEAGMGIAFDKKVIVVGEHPDYGTWQYHPSVIRIANLMQALSYILS